MRNKNIRARHFTQSLTDMYFGTPSPKAGIGTQATAGKIMTPKNRFHVLKPIEL